jgi:D-alanine-D-alanine ligase
MKTVLILCGGKSDEHEISLISAKCVLDALDRKQYKPLVVGISRKGQWHFEDEKDFFTGEFRADKIALNEKAPKTTIAPYLVNGQGQLLYDGKTASFDVVFPVLHGQFGEDGTLQGLLDIIGVPYVGSNCGSSWICMDKLLTKSLCQREDIPVAPFVYASHPDDVDSKRREIEKLGLPLFVKPNRQGSSVGVSKVKTLSELRTAVAEALKFDSKCLIEQGINGREIETAVLGLNQAPKVALPGEIIPSSNIGWYSYEAKYLLSDGAETVVPANLDDRTVKRVQEFALRVFTVLECDGLARIDLFLEKGTDKIYLNEANTIPGFTPISMYPKMWQASGMTYPALINELLALAFRRLAPKP